MRLVDSVTHVKLWCLMSRWHAVAENECPYSKQMREWRNQLRQAEIKWGVDSQWKRCSLLDSGTFPEKNMTLPLSLIFGDLWWLLYWPERKHDWVLSNVLVESNRTFFPAPFYPSSFWFRSCGHFDHPPGRRWLRPPPGRGLKYYYQRLMEIATFVNISSHVIAFPFAFYSKPVFWQIC